MSPIVLQSGTAHDLLVAVIAGWITIEVLLQLRSAGQRLAWDWTFPLVVAAITVGASLGFQAGHYRTGNIGGGWWPVARLIALAFWLVIALAGAMNPGRATHQTPTRPARGRTGIYTDFAASRTPERWVVRAVPRHAGEFAIRRGSCAR